MKISRHAHWERKRGLVFQHRENSALPFQPLNASLLALFRRMEKRARNWSWCNLPYPWHAFAFSLAVEQGRTGGNEEEKEDDRS